MSRILRAFLLLAWLASAFGPAPAAAQSVRPDAASLLAAMTPEERVGQLFLVTFTGTEVGAGTHINDLVINYHIGGVVLRRANDNFSAAPETVADAQVLIETLQRAEWVSSQMLTPVSDGGPLVQPAYVPLFIGVAQDGGGYPDDQLLSGMTTLPEPMAIGATWQPELAERAGRVLGGELSAIGFNLLLGPSLDVLETPDPAGSGDLGARVFGGDPYWVGRMGQAYISGLHTGSDGRLLVIAKHFPGRGSSDRLPEDEVATVRRSLEQLKQIELAPFFAVTGDAPSAAATTDGLLVSHIRYQGFQGNIRATTRPVSFDAQSLAQILDLPAFGDWRTGGGLMVSDDLGSRAVRQFYAPGGQIFSARLVARDAFLAGNDLLYLGGIVSSDATDSYESAVQTLEFFAQKYREDPAFAARVDQSALRILQAKLRLYPTLTLASVITAPDELANVGASQAVTFDVAQQAATLLSPSVVDLAAVLPEAPAQRDWIVFITDPVQARQCSECPLQDLLAQDALQQAVLRLYGPDAGGQVLASHLSSYSFADLEAMLSGGFASELESDLRGANYVVLLQTDSTRGQPDLIRAFLSERQDLLRDRRVIVFSFDAPYYLDATDISRLTAYYGLYSTAAPFVDVAARLLYQETTPQGASPVSIAAVDYDLITVTSPDPRQVIELALDLPAPAGSETPGPTPVPLFRAGDGIAVRTGPVLDHNGNPVPDGTVVRFSLILAGESGGVVQQVDTVTEQGVARATLRLDRAGLLEIRAVSEPAVISQVLQVDVSGGPAVVTIIAPPATETGLPGTPAPQAPAGSGLRLTVNGYPRFGAWLIAMLFLLAGAGLALWAGGRMDAPRWGLRWGLCVFLGGMLGYLYLDFGLPGGPDWVFAAGMGAVIGAVLIGMLLGLAAAGIWVWRERGK